MANQFAMPPEIQYTATPSFGGGNVTPEQKARFAELQAKFAKPVQQGPTPEQKTRFAELEAKFGNKQPSEPINTTAGVDMGSGAAAVQGFNSAVPFGERAAAGIGSMGAYLYDNIAGDSNLSLGDYYDTARENQANTSEASPNAYLGGAVTGIAATLPAISAKAIGGGAAATSGIRGGINAIPEALTSVGNYVRGSKVAADAGKLAKAGNLAGKAVRSATVAAPTNALYSYGASQNELDSSGAVEDAADGFGMGATVGGALPVAGAVLGKAISPFMKKSPVMNADKIRELAGESYKTATEKGGLLTAQFTDKFVDNVGKMKPQTEAGKLLMGDNPVSKIADRIEKLRGKNLSLDEAQEIDEFLGDAIDEFTELGTVNKQGKKLLDIQSAFRNMIEDVPETEIVGGKEGFEALKDGRFLWSQAAKMRDIEKIITRAEMMPNPATGIKTGFRTLYNNPSRMKGFSAEEKKLIKKAAETGVIADFLSTFGSRLIPIGTVVSGGGLGGSIAAQAATTASRSGAAKLQVGRANDVARAISSNVENRVSSRASQIPDMLTSGPTVTAVSRNPAYNKSIGESVKPGIKVKVWKLKDTQTGKTNYEIGEFGKTKPINKKEFDLLIKEGLAESEQSDIKKLISEKSKKKDK